MLSTDLAVFVDHIFTLESSDPDAIKRGFIRLKSTHQHLFSCSFTNGGNGNGKQLQNKHNYKSLRPLQIRNFCFRFAQFNGKPVQSVFSFYLYFLLIVDIQFYFPSGARSLQEKPWSVMVHRILDLRTQQTTEQRVSIC